MLVKDKKQNKQNEQKKLKTKLNFPLSSLVMQFQTYLDFNYKVQSQTATFAQKFTVRRKRKIWSNIPLTYKSNLCVCKKLRDSVYKGLSIGIDSSVSTSLSSGV